MIRAWATRHRATIFHWSMEVVIVVIGILIAFALQDWAQDRADKRRAADAERRIRGEVLGNAENLVERVAIFSCLRDNGESLMRDLIAGDATGLKKTFDSGPRQSFLRIVYPVPARSSGSDVYRGALAAGELVQVSPERRAVLAAQYRASDRLDALNAEENELADRLLLLQLGVRLSRSERNSMVATLARLDSINGLIRLISLQYLDRLHRDKTGFSQRSRSDGFSREDWARDLAYMRARYGSCVEEEAINAFVPHATRG